MPLISQKIVHLLNGVSQRPAVQRHPTQLEASSNAWANLARGLMKRPGTTHVGKLATVLTGWDTAQIHPINRDDNDRSRLVIANQVVRIYDAINSVELPITDRSFADGYLSDAGGKGFRVATVGDNSIIVNRNIVTAKGTNKALAQPDRAYVTVSQADSSTEYEITLQDQTVRYVTPDLESERARGLLTTEKIAEELILRITANAPLNLLFTTEQLGPTIAISWRTLLVPSVFPDMKISVRDGLHGSGLKLARRTVQSIEDLPPRAFKNEVMKVTGDPIRKVDDYWVKFDTDETNSDVGVWRETLGPGIIEDFDKDTMPHRLVLSGSILNGLKRMTSIPGSPRISFESAGADTLKPWDKDELDAAASGTADKLVTDEGKGWRHTLSFVATGQLWNICTKYTLDTSKLLPGITTIVSLWKDPVSGGADVLLASKEYAPGEYFEGEEFDVDHDFILNDQIKMLLTYGSEATPATGEKAALTVPGSGPGISRPVGEPITARKRLILRLAWINATDDAELPSHAHNYPEGAKLVLTLNESVGGDEVFTHTVTTGGQTNSQVSIALKNLVSASANYVAVSQGSTPFSVFDVTLPLEDARPTFVSFTQDLGASAPSSRFYNEDLTLTPGEFAGITIENVTDGSSGTISANTINTITAELTGGVDNVFGPFDQARVLGTGRSFVYEPVEWTKRGAGDDDTNPMPSFIGQKITEPFFYQNRLGFLAGENIILSRSGDLFNFFRQSAIDLLDDDVVDIRSAHSEVSIFHSFTLWDGTAYIWAENAQFILSGAPTLGPSTVRLDLVSRFFNSDKMRPVVLGRSLYFAHRNTDSTRIFEYLPETEDRPVPSVRDLTLEVPTYLEGAPLDIAGDAALGTLIVLTNGRSQESLWAYSWAENAANGQLISSGWNRWDFAPGMKILQIDSVDGKFGILSKHSDGIYLSDLDLDRP